MSISLICAIERPASAGLNIKWFFQGSQTTNVTQISSDSHHNITVTNTEVTNTEASYQLVMAQSVLTITPVSVGQYWCRAFYGSNGLKRSQKLEVLDVYDERLGLDPCTVPIAESVKKCNNIIESLASYSVCPISSSSGILTTSTIYISSTTSLLYSSSFTFSSNVFDDMTPSNTVFLSNTYTAATTSSNLVNPPPSKLPIDPNPRDSFHIWIYLLGGLIGVLVILIIVLSLICIGLCLTKPKGKHTSKQNNVQTTILL